MESYRHAAISAVASLAISYSLFQQPQTILVYAAFGTLAGTLIDLDHFVLARLNTGNWKRLQNALRQPGTAFTDGKEVMQETITSRQRYLSHLTLLFASTGSVFLIAGVKAAVLTFSVISLHICCDLYVSFKKL
ncbi:MAG: hypothetical protein ABEJ98_03875 [Candidatus Nanohaloarchaea archaeon]